MREVASFAAAHATLRYKQRMSGGDNGKYDEWTEEQIETFLYGFFLLTIVALVSFFIYIRPRRLTPGERERLVQQQQQLYRDLQAARQRRQQEERGGVGQKQLVDGIMPFRHGSAAKWTPSDMEKKDWRQKQCQLFQSLFQSGNEAVIPTRGCNMVVTLRTKEWDDVYAAKVLTMLGASYNLFIILDIPRDESELQNEKVKLAREKLRKHGLPEGIVSDHRIVASHSITGRVAFVRQLRPEILVDYEEEVKNQLSRFGFRVVLPSREGEDGLGVFLSDGKVIKEEEGKQESKINFDE